MGDFYLYKDELRPSDSYLEEHPLEFEVWCDTEHEDYDIEDDDEAYTMDRVCEECGEIFHLDDMNDIFMNYCHQYGVEPEGLFLYYTDGGICQHCAAYRLSGVKEHDDLTVTQAANEYFDTDRDEDHMHGYTEEELEEAYYYQR